MAMMLIADSGSTKTDWILTDGKTSTELKTIGYNPYFVDSEGIYESIKSEFDAKIEPGDITRIHFYGAGCSNEKNNIAVKRALEKYFKDAVVSVEHDMLAAARALLDKKPGFAAILGTGANTCIYNGNKIVRNIDSLGYLLGDEGSGAYIGKKILRDFLRGFLPEDLQSKFKHKYVMSESEIYTSLYHQNLPNRFLAGFCEFASENKKHEHIQKIVETSFNDFFRHLVVRYPAYGHYSFNCIGAVGFLFKDLLEKTCSAYNMNPGKIIRSPIKDLVNFHLKV